MRVISSPVAFKRLVFSSPVAFRTLVLSSSVAFRTFFLSSPVEFKMLDSSLAAEFTISNCSHPVLSRCVTFKLQLDSQCLTIHNHMFMMPGRVNYDFNWSTMNPKFHPTGFRTYDLLIITVQFMSLRLSIQPPQPSWPKEIYTSTLSQRSEVTMHGLLGTDTLVFDVFGSIMTWMEVLCTQVLTWRGNSCVDYEWVWVFWVFLARKYWRRWNKKKLLSQVN